MPYITQEDRDDLELGPPETPGELNYEITMLLVEYLAVRGESYQTYNDMIGVLEAAKMELYRRKVIGYEEKKRKLNGDVW